MHILQKDGKMDPRNQVIDPKAKISAQTEETERRISELKRVFKRNAEKIGLLRSRLNSGSTAEERYNLEYSEGLYQAYKPGIDDLGLADIIKVDLGMIFMAIEIGAGPAYILQNIDQAHCSRSKATLVSVDFVDPPGYLLRETFNESGHDSVFKFGHFEFFKHDVTSAEFARDLLKYVGQPQGGYSLVILSYCLDRVSDQTSAIRSFSEVVKRLDAVGLITVCLPAFPTSPGLPELDYSCNWVTKGKDPVEDYWLIAKECRKNDLVLIDGGLTTHYGFNIADGWEELPCYVMVLEKY